MEELVAKFLEKRAISKEIELNQPLSDSIYFLELSDEFVGKSCHDNLDRLSEIVPWSSMHDMYNRNYEYCCGILGCFLIGQFASAEALCRTAIEGSVNLHYVSLGDSMKKQIAYFKAHIENERTQNKLWRESVQKSDYPKSAKEEHYKRIEDKDKSLDGYEEALRASLALAGVSYVSHTGKWPSIFDRFREIGNEVGYRTVYTALCSQAHNDAEDVLNRIMSRVVDGIEGLAEAQLVEQYHFSLYLILTALDYHIFASAMYLAKFEIKVEELVKLKFKVQEAAVEVMENGQRVAKTKIRKV